MHTPLKGAPAYATAKEMVAALAGAFIDREVETKGLDWIDRERAKDLVTVFVEEGFTEEVHASYSS